MANATGAVYAVHFRRRRDGRTDFNKRLALLKSGKIRLIVRKTNRYVIVQFAQFDLKGDRIIASCTSRMLQKFGYPGKCNTPSAYLSGLLCGKDALKKGVKEAVLDIGLHKSTKGNVIFAALKGAVDAGISIPFSEEVLPSPERMSGAHLKDGVAEKFQECRKKIMAQ